MRQLLCIAQLVLGLIVAFGGNSRPATAQHADQKPGGSIKIDVEWSKLSAPASEQWIAAEWSNSSKPLLGAVGATHVVVWDPTTQKAVVSVPHEVRLLANWFPRIRIRLSPDGRQVAVAFPDRGTTLRRWNVADGTALNELTISGLSFADFAFSNASDRVFVLGSDGRLFGYDLATGNRETKLLEHPARYDNAHLSVTGAPILVVHRVGRDREVLMWERDLSPSKQLAFYRDVTSFDTFTISARGDMFVGSFTDVKSRPWIYPITFRHPLVEERFVIGRGTLSPITDIAIAPHGCFFVLMTRDGQLTFWDALANCAIVHTDLDGQSPLRVTISPDCRQVAVFVSSGTVKVSKIASWFLRDKEQDKSLASLIGDLGSSNPADANSAFFAFLGDRKAAIKALSGYLSRIAPEMHDWKQLASQLASDDFATRESAEGILRDAGESVLGELRQQSREHSSAEARWRLSRIADALTESPLSPRMKRAISILQSIAGPDARALLCKLQKHASRAIRIEATRALELLDARTTDADQSLPK